MFSTQKTTLPRSFKTKRPSLIFYQDFFANGYKSRFEPQPKTMKVPVVHCEAVCVHPAEPNTSVHLQRFETQCRNLCASNWWGGGFDSGIHSAPIPPSALVVVWVGVWNSPSKYSGKRFAVQECRGVARSTQSGCQSSRRQREVLCWTTGSLSS